MNDLLTEIHFWAQIIGDSKRTVVCSPELESRVKGWIGARGMGGIIKVIVNPYCSDNRIFVIDEQGQEAALRESVLRAPFRWGL